MLAGVFITRCPRANWLRLDQTMYRNVFYLTIGALAVVAVVFGYQFYQDRHKPTGIEINIGERGISVEKK
jgi:hypothetical protein